MSNVIIGIIGVILFIGLALAGANFLGPRFTGASADSKASIMISRVGDAAVAMGVYQAKEGTPPGGTLDFLSPRYLKSIPENPVSGGAAIDARTAAGAYGGSAVAVIATMPVNSVNGKVCATIASRSGLGVQADGSAPSAATLPSYPQGCWQLAGTWGSLTGPVYVVYKRI